MFSHRHQRRRWAARVLLLWLFGVGAGVANACLGPTSSHSGSHGIASVVSLAVLHDELAPANGPHDHAPSRGHQHAGHTGHDVPPGSSTCERHCDTAGISIPSPKSTFDDGHGNALFLLPASTAVGRDRAFALVPRLVLRRDDDAWAPPIQIAFMRLAL